MIKYNCFSDKLSYKLNMSSKDFVKLGILWVILSFLGGMFWPIGGNNNRSESKKINNNMVSKTEFSVPKNNLSQNTQVTQNPNKQTKEINISAEVKIKN